MKSAFIIAGLTLKEAVRRKTFLGSLLMGVMILGISLLLVVIHYNMRHAVTIGKMNEMQYAIRYPQARSFVTQLCLFSIKSLGALFAVLMAGGAISSEIERGVLSVILPKPMTRWQILLGKWIGLNVILIGSVLLWTTLVWASLFLQVKIDLTKILFAGPIIAIAPVVICTLALSLSTMTQRLAGSTIALTLCAFSWFDGIFNALGSAFDVHSLNVLADVAGMVVPQGYIAWWVEHTTQEVIIPSRGQGWASSQFVQEWGANHLHFQHLDAIYVVVYIFAAFIVGAFFFQKRDVG